jgi:hypothetical protein
MNPNRRNLFMKKLTRDRVVPIISASVSWLTLAMTDSGFPSLPKFASNRRSRARRFSLESKSSSTAVLRDYSGKAVCILFEMLSGMGLIVHAFYWAEFDREVFMSAAQLLTTAIAAASFWNRKSEPLALKISD